MRYYYKEYELVYTVGIWLILVTEFYDDLDAKGQETRYTNPAGGGSMRLPLCWTGINVV